MEKEEKKFLIYLQTTLIIKGIIAMNILKNTYYALGLYNKEFVIMYLVGFVLLIAGVFNVKAILFLMKIWTPQARDVKYNIIRIFAIVLGVLLILSPISYIY